MQKLCLPNNFTYVNYRDVKGNKEFRIKEVKDGTTAEAWVQEYSKISFTTWRVLKTYPNAGVRNIYRKDFRCQHFTDRRASGSKPSKNTNCPAKLEVIVKRYVEKSKAKIVDPFVKDYPAVIVMKGDHNHPIISADTLKHRDMSFETKEKLSNLFRRGHNPSSARYLLKMGLMLEYGDEYYKVAGDGQYLPSLSAVVNLFKKDFEADYGNFNGDSMFEHLHKFLKEYSEGSGGKAEFRKTSDGLNYFVVVITPVMLRAHMKLQQSGELVMLDASGGMDKQRHRLYAFVTPTAAGGIPLGMIITDCEKESVLEQALNCYKQLLAEDGFFSLGFPKVYLTDNDLKERNALKKCFPASTLLLCQFHILKAMWSWLCNRNHSIEQVHRQELYFLFKNVVYSFTEEKVKENTASFIARVTQLNYPNLLNHFSMMRNFQEDWISFFRRSLTIRGNNTTNYVEIVFRILKDIIFDRTLAYNVIQMVDFIVSKYEMYLKQRLSDFANGRYSNSLLAKMLPQKIDPEAQIETTEEEGIFHVNSKKGHFKVDMIRGLCSCTPGQSGKLCNHASAVYLNLDHSSTSFNIVNTETRCLMMYIANGLEPEKEWFKPLIVSDVKCLDGHQKSVEENESLEIGQPEALRDQGETNLTNSEGVNKGVEITQRDKDLFYSFISSIESGLESNPEVFKPAFKKMVGNIEKFVTTQSGLVSTMYTMGTYTGLGRANSHRQRVAKNIVRRCHKNKIGVQPTAIGRRKFALSGKRKGNVGRPSGSNVAPKELCHHQYTTFGMLPKRKRKAPHNLEQCVYDNKSLGK